MEEKVVLMSDATRLKSYAERRASIFNLNLLNWSRAVYHLVPVNGFAHQTFHCIMDGTMLNMFSPQFYRSLAWA